MKHVLEGIQVVDFTHVFAGPLTTQILGDLGADVIKIERVDGGDATRYYGLSDEQGSMSGPFLALNRNKRSLALDLSKEDGRQIARDLVMRADVVVENFRRGVMDRWGLGAKALLAEKPDLIYCSISGFGRIGPLADRAANDLIVQAYSGLLSFTGEPGRPPVRCATAISDFSAGLHAALGILAAVIHRFRTGKGQEVTTSMLESQIGMMNYFFAEYWLLDVVPKPMGTANRLGMPNQAFPTQDGWVVITAANDRMWERCCRALGAPEMAFDERFATLGRRYENRDVLVEAISKMTRQRSTRELLEALDHEGVSCGPILTVPEVADDEQVKELGLVKEVDRGDGGTSRVIGNPIHLSDAEMAYGPVPTLGQHSREILAELDYDESRISQLIASGVVATSEGAV